MKLSQSAAYAIHSVLLLAGAREGEPVSCAELAKKGVMPHRFLLQILRELAKRGIVRPTRGGGGGFALERSPAAVSLLDVIEAIDGTLIPSRLSLGSLPSHIAQRVQDALARVADAHRGMLRNIALSDLLAPAGLGDGEVEPGPVA
jgi:Rrf2 family protein